MTTRPEDEPRVLVFVDILGFEVLTREVVVRVEDYQYNEHGRSGSSTTGLHHRILSFSRALDSHIFKEDFLGGVQAMLFSDCALLVYEDFPRAASSAASLMRCFINHRVPVRMGLGKGTFYGMEYATAVQSRVVSKSRFYGTAVIHAHAAEQCGGKGMRIFLHESLDEDLLNLTGDGPRPMKLRRPLKDVNHELGYLHERTPKSKSPSADDQDRTLFENVALMKNPAWSNKVLRQYSETFAALNRMRKANSRRAVAAHRLPCNAPDGTIW